MRLIAYIIMTICLTLGAVAATTAYSPSLSLADDKLVGLTLNADAGAIGEGDEARPIAEQDDTLDEELLERLRQGGVERVRVKEFSLARWDYAWMMGLACAGLVLAAFMLKWETKQRLKAELAAGMGAEPSESPELALKEIRATVENLLAQLPGLATEEERNDLIIERIGGLQWTHIQAILDARSKLVARLGLTGFAEFMDRFSALERRLNRAWSAAADGVFEEALLSLQEADAMFGEVQEKLSATKG